MYYAFSSDASRNDWGYRFAVRARRRPPLTPDADARLAVACAVIDAALGDAARAPALGTGACLEAVAAACCAADGARQRGLLGCLARLAARADEVADEDLPGDEVFRPVVEALVRAVDSRRAAGEPVGSPDVFARALAVSAWCVAPRRPALRPHAACAAAAARAGADAAQVARAARRRAGPRTAERCAVAPYLCTKPLAWRVRCSACRCRCRCRCRRRASARGACGGGPEPSRMAQQRARCTARRMPARARFRTTGRA